MKNKSLMHNRPPLSDRRKLLQSAVAGVSMGGMLSAGSAAVIDVTATPPPSNTNILLTLFSRPGENYYHRNRIDLEVGNTRVLAGMIGDRIDCDVYEIEAADPYSESYDETVNRNVREQNANARPTIENPLASIDAYDTIIIGSPIWNVRPPMIMESFADSFDFTGKTILPIVTYAVSGMGNTERVYQAACPGANLGIGLAVKGEDVVDVPDDVAEQVEAWLDQIALTGSRQSS